MTVRYKWLIFLILGVTAKLVDSVPPSNPQVMPPSSVVTELNIWTFRGSVGDGRLWFVKFYVPWCRGCKRMVGQYDELAQTFMSNKNVAIARFDCMQDEDMCERLGVDRTPTLKLFLNGTDVETYKADFYHVELMTPFLLRMLEKYMGDKAIQARGNGDADATAAGSAADLNKEDTGKPAEPHADKATGACGASEATAGVDTHSGSGIQATPVEPGTYNRAPGARTSAMERGGRGAGAGVEEESSTLHAEAPGAPTEGAPGVGIVSGEEVVVTTIAAAPVPACGDGIHSASGGGAEPLTRRGRHGGLAMETLQREKEEL
ncbi:hypothetical protein VOLCADRAFT_118770 [Volvox carteri f. nagariensis]|uniref:Thioredoxin domain-containing protein n=1 Tax=Volvox carteri f. nagariensis TaxID=3068 RepID=D8U7B8_VOLCA|nr:uncharacterized protein VOLCADRAFT_118770 [Volvox carteri f. nagariensis]EFJ44393.1 hypothetical protein VOLCADRAFT_118770 [Volvox carteri f. nagariensis]|eukprot:XP_002954500.1 hypothetical protein VOLCADRAFT_118770 [Volvox carteri f. nagariensis]